jgi:hypothetical protein
MAFVFEVVEFITKNYGEGSWRDLGGKHKHIGYMKGKFKTKNDAASYYKRHNPGMRPLNYHGNYCSDWDPNTKLLYIVREDYLMNSSIDCFSTDDNTEINTTYKWLK